MALEQTGVQLEAKGLDSFVASMSKAENKARDFATQLLGAARAENTFDVAMQKVVNSALAAQDRLAAQARTAGILQTEITTLTTKYGEASTQVERKKAALERLNSQMASTERQIGTYTAQIIEMAAKTEQATKDQAAQAAALDEQRRAYAAMAQSVDQLSQEYGDNSAQVKAQRASLEAMASSLDAAEKAARRTADGVDEFGRSIRENNSKVDKFREITVGAFREIGAIGLDKAQEALSGIGRFFTDSIKLAGDFEGSMMRFASVTGSAMQQSGLDTDDFRKLFLKMGADTQYSALQASDAAVELAKGGIAPATIAAGALKDALALASAGELSLASAANITAKQLGVWSDQGVTSADVANLMAQAANASTVGVEELALGLANVGGVAKVSGLSFRETLVAMAELAPGFSSAADAGTSFKAFLTGLTNTSKPAIEAMEMLGLRTEDGKNKFFDAQGSFIGMKEATELLSQATKDLSEEQKQMALKAIFGSDAIRAAAIFAEGGAKGFEDMAAAMGTAGLASDQAAAKQQGYNANMEQFQGSMETLQIVIGTKLLPTITEFVGVLTSVANSLGDFLQASERLEALRAETTAGAKSFEEYKQKLDAINENTPFWVDAPEDLLRLLNPIDAVMLGFEQLSDRSDTLTRGQFELVQAFVKTGMSGEDALKRVTERTDEFAGALEMAIQTSSNPAIVSGLNAIDQQMLALVDHGGAWAQATEDAFAKFRQTGDINALIADINGLSSAYTTAQQALSIQASPAAANFEALGISADKSTTAMAGLSEAASRYAQIAPSVVAANKGIETSAQLSEEQVEGLNKALVKINQEGVKAASEALNSHSNYLLDQKKNQETHNAKMQSLQSEFNAATTQKDRERIAAQMKQEQDGFAEQTVQTAIAYGAQRMTQQAHLGELLIQHVQAWGAMNGISQERITEMTGQIAQKFGVAKDSTVLMFGEMTTAAEGWLLGTETSAAGVANGMINNQNAAANAQARYKEIFNTMKADLDQQLADGKISIDQYNAKLAEIPARVDVVVETSLNNQKLIDDANTAQAEARGKGQEVGGAFAEGMAKGIELNRKVVAAAAMAAVDHSADAAKWRAGIHSPSRLFATEVGIPISEGIAVGILEGEGAIQDAINGVMDSAAQTGGYQADRLRDAMERGGRGATDGLAGAISGAGGAIQGAINGIMDGALLTAEEKMARLRSILSKIGDQIGGPGPGDGGGGAKPFPLPGFGGERALGGPVSANSTYLVGEQGPELFIPQSAGTIIPAAQPQMMSYVNNTTQSTANNYTYAPTYAAAPPPAEHDFALLMARAAI